MDASRRPVSPSVPSSSPNHSVHPSAPGSSPTSHYDTSTGYWDGQLAHPDIAGGLSPAGILEKPPENWPTIIERDGFADLATVTFDLTGPESAVLRRILFRAGSASQGCWESLPNMGRYLGINEKTVRRALARLLDLGLIHKVKAYHGDGKSNCYVPVLRLSHFGLSAQNEENNASIMDSVSLHSGLSAHQTEGTEIVTASESIDSEFHGSQKVGDSKLTSASVHCGQRVQNEPSPDSIPGTKSRMDGTPASDMTECHVCGLPWTSDPDRHRVAVRRGLREFICDQCREVQIAVAGGIDRLATS